ncbi:hypothetical protein CLM76_03790 [Vreelandella venusta]|nr:hypothetical protein CLM76_03790 [Halomonas hydrothermalis]
MSAHESSLAGLGCLVRPRFYRRIVDVTGHPLRAPFNLTSTVGMLRINFYSQLNVQKKSQVMVWMIFTVPDTDSVTKPV